MRFKGSIVGGIAAFSLLFLNSCATQQYLTGEPVLFGIRNSTGEIVDRDLATGNPAVHKGEIITLVANSVFVKLLKDSGNPDVLAYVEVYDDGTDDPDRAYRRVIYKGANTPQGVLLGVSDKVIYGPTPYKGFPLRVKLFVVELDKDQKKQTSQLLNAVGSIAQASQPQYAAAIGVVMQAAQALNQLNEDDFELRFDMTLYPSSPSFTYDIANANLAKLKEPVQRQSKQIHLTTPLRAGSFAVLKRELPKRFSTSFTNNADLANATLILDPAQEGFLKNYTLADKPGKQVTATEVLRFQGGYLYHVIADITSAGKSLNSAIVVDPDNPHNKTALTPGIRQFYRERTYVTFTLLNGLPESLNDAAMRSTSDKQLEQIRNLLDNPDQLPASTQLKPYVDNLANAVIAGVEQRKLANQAARRTGLNQEFRTSGDYPVFWLQNLATIDDKAPDKAAQVSKNAGLLATVSEFAVNIPVVKPDSTNCIAALKSLAASDFEPVVKHPGYFNLTTNALEKLKSCK